MEEKELVELKLKANDGDLEANITLYKYYKSIGESDQADAYYDEALDLGWEGEDDEEEQVVEEVETKTVNDFDDSFLQVLATKYANLKLYELKTLADKYDIYAGYQLSKIYYEKGEVKEAIQQLERIKGDLENAGSEKILYRVFKILANSYEEIGEYEKAFDCYQNAVELPYSKEDLDRYSDLIRCYDEGIGCEVNEAKATELMKKMSDRNYLYCVRIADSYKAEGKMTDAQAYYEKALSFKDHQGEVMYRYAKINYNLLDKNNEDIAEDLEYCLSNSEDHHFLARIFNIAAAMFTDLADGESKLKLALTLLSEIPAASLAKIGVSDYLLSDLEKTILFANQDQLIKLFDSVSLLVDEEMKAKLHEATRVGLSKLDAESKGKFINNALGIMNLDSLVNLGVLDTIFANSDILCTMSDEHLQSLFNGDASDQAKSKLYSLAATNFANIADSNKVSVALRLFDLLNIEALNSVGICYFILNNIDDVMMSASDDQIQRIYDIKLSKDGEKETIAFFEKYIDKNKVISDKLADYRVKQERKLKKKKDLQRKLSVVAPIVLLLLAGFMFVTLNKIREARVRDVALNSDKWIAKNQNLYLEKATDIYDVEMKNIISFNESNSASFSNATKFQYLTLFYTFEDGTNYDDAATITVVTDNGQNDYTVNVRDAQSAFVVELGDTKNITVNSSNPSLILVQPRVFVDYDEAVSYGEKLAETYKYNYSDDVIGLQNAILLETVGNVILGDECVFNAANEKASLLIANNKYKSLHGSVKTGPQGASLVASVDGVEVYSKNYNANVERDFDFNFGDAKDVKITVTGELIMVNPQLDVNQVEEPTTTDLFSNVVSGDYSTLESATTSLGKTLSNVESVYTPVSFELGGRYEVLELTFNIQDGKSNDILVRVFGDNGEELLKMPVTRFDENKSVCLDVSGVKKLTIIPDSIGTSYSSFHYVLVSNANLYVNGSELIDECEPRMNRVALNNMHQVEAESVYSYVTKVSNIGETLYNPLAFEVKHSLPKLVVYPNQEYKKLYGTINMSKCKDEVAKLNIFSDDVLVSSLEIGSSYEPYYFEVDIQETKFLRFEVEGETGYSHFRSIYLSDTYLERK